MRRIATASVSTLVFVLTACGDIPDVTQPRILSLHSAPSATLVDGAHGGIAGFYFLPPIAPRPRVNGEFDATLAPVVEACVWRANACGSPLVSRLNARVEGDQYGVEWKTNGLGLDPAKQYRLRVFVAGSELGSVDVAVLRNGSDKKSVDPNAVAIVAGQTLPIKFRIERGAVFVLGTSGGTITAFNGQVQLEIPAGAVEGDVGFTVQQVQGAPQSGGFVVPGATYEFGPNGLRFHQPVQLTLRYSESALPSGVDETLLRLQKLVGSAWEVVPHSSVDVSANTVTGAISGFSTYGVVTWTSGDPEFSGFGTAVVDGILSANEWDGAASTPFSVNLPDGSVTNGNIYVMNDATNLYLAVETARPAADARTEVRFAFDNDNDGGAQETGDDLLDAYSTMSGVATFIDEWFDLSSPCSGFGCGKVDGGFADGSAAFQNNGTTSVFEFVHPLNTGDNAHDFSLSVGDVVGFSMVLDIHDASNNLGQTWFPSTLWGHIRLLSSPVIPPPSAVLDTGTATAGLNHSCAISTAGSTFPFPEGFPYCWGANLYGAVGDGTSGTGPKYVPTTVAGGLTFRKISAGSADGFVSAHTCGVASNTVYCWGLGTSGQLGDGTNNNSNTPVAVASPGPFGFAQITAGRQYTCALGGGSGGVAYCWGANAFGVFGDGTTTSSNVPVPISGPPYGFYQMSAGDVHTCGTTISQLYCWGANSFGQLGLGTQGAPHLTPEFVGNDFLWVSAGADHTCAVKTNGDLYCWGLNTYGQLGDGTTTMRTSPVKIGGGFQSVDVGGKSMSSGPSTIAAYTCAVTTTFRAYCWGLNASGQLGIGVGPSPAFYTTPQPVVGNHSWRHISAGVDHTCGVTQQGDTYCWGSGLYGGLGNGSQSGSLVPLLVSGGLKFF